MQCDFNVGLSTGWFIHGVGRGRLMYIDIERELNINKPKDNIKRHSEWVLLP